MSGGWIWLWIWVWESVGWLWRRGSGCGAACRAAVDLGLGDTGTRGTSSGIVAVKGIGCPSGLALWRLLARDWLGHPCAFGRPRPPPQAARANHAAPLLLYQMHQSELRLARWSPRTAPRGRPSGRLPGARRTWPGSWPSQLCSSRILDLSVSLYLSIIGPGWGRVMGTGRSRMRTFRRPAPATGQISSPSLVKPLLWLLVLHLSAPYCQPPILSLLCLHSPAAHL